MLQPKSKFTPPSDAVVVESESNFVPPSDAVVLKKKESAESTSTSQENNGDSETKIGSSGTLGSNGFPAIDQNLGVPGLKPDLKTVEQLANPPKSKATIPNQKEIKKDEVDGFGEGLLNRLDTGIARVSKSFYDAPKMILDAIYAPQNYLSEKLNIPSLKVDPETYAFENIPSKTMDEIVSKNNKKIENYKKEIGGDVVSTFDKGDYVNTFKHAALNSMESAPLIAAAMATGGESLLANSIMIGSSASTQYDQLTKEHPEMETRTKLANAAVNGALEVAVGKFMEGVGGNVWKNVLANKGVKETAQIATNSFKKTLEKVVGDSPMVGVAGGYAEERITDGLQQLNDIATGASTEFNWDQNKNAGLSSLGFGLPNATALYSAKAYISNKTRKRVTETSKQIVKLQNDLQNPELSPENKKIISENISKIYDENKKILGDELEKLEIMPEKTKKELVGIDKNIDKIKDNAIDIKYDVNISPENKALLLKNLEQDFKDNINRKNEILSKTSEVEFLPLKEQDKIKRQALKELTAEQNPDGTKNIEIDNTQIVERANKIYKANEELKTPTPEAQPQAEVPQQAEAEKVDKKPTIVVHGAVNGFGLQYSEGIDEKDIVTPQDARGFLPQEDQVSLNKGNSVIQEDNVLDNGDKKISILTPSTDSFGRSSVNNFEFTIPTNNTSTTKGIQSVLDDVRNGDLSGKELIDETVKQVKKYIDSNEIIKPKETPKPQEVSPVEDVVATNVEKKTIKQLEAENKTTLPKIPSNKIFKNEVTPLTQNQTKGVDKIIEQNKENDLPTQKIDIGLIVPTQKTVNTNNLKKTSEITEETKISEPIVLVKENGKYYVVDGHHRISNEILNGNTIVEAKVFDNEATQETNPSANGNIQPRVEPMGESGTAKQQSPAKENLPSTVDGGEVKGDVEVDLNLDDVSNFLNEQFGAKKLVEVKETPKPKKEVTPKQDKVEQAKGFVTMAVGNLTTSLKDFQGRAKEFSEDTYNRIVNEAKEGALNISAIPPVQIWKDPKTGEFVILAGHSRTKAFSDLANGEIQYDSKYKKSDFTNINAQIVEAETLQEAQKIAQESNQGAVQTVVDNAKYVRENLLPTFNNFNQAKTKLKSLYGSAWARIYAYANLNPRGKAMQMLKQFQDANESDSNDKSKKIAEWTGKARQEFSNLTDAHENEIFDYLSKNDKIKTYAELGELLNRRVNGLEEFNQNEPLNFEQKVGRGSNEVEIVKEIQDLKNRDVQIKKKIKELQSFGKNINDTQRKQVKDLTAESIKINTVDIPNAQKKQKQARAADAEQFDIFSQINEQIENGNITPEQVDEFVNDDRKAEEIDPIVEVIESKAKGYNKAELEEVVAEVDAVLANEENKQSKTKKQPLEKTIKVYHGGNLDGKGRFEDGNFYVAKDKSQAEAYTKENRGKVYEYEVDENKLLEESVAREILTELGIEPRNGYDVEELGLHEILDDRFDTSITEENFNKFKSEVEKRGFVGISFTDEDITQRNKFGVENAVIFNPKVLFNTKKQRKEKLNAEVDKIADKIKDLLPGINDPDLNKQGISQDDLIDLVANAVKALVSKGIDINDAIRQVIASIKERFNVDVDENLVKAKLGVEKPKSKTKNPLREKSSEEISDELGISEKDYLDLKAFVANEPSSGIFNEYLSADTIADVFGDGPTNNQQYEQMVLLNAVQHGNSVLEKARSIFGENYMSKTLEFLQNVKLGNFEKAMVYAALENEIDTLVKANPSNKVFLATQRLIYADSQANLRNSSKGLNAGRLRRIHNAIKNGYDIDKVTSGLIKPEQQEAKQILKDAIPTGENLNKASEQEENTEIDSEERVYTQNELDEAIEKARLEFEEENLGFEIRESKTKIKKEDALEQIRKIKENWKKASRDGTLSASLPYAKQIIAVTPDVIQLAKLYSQIAGMKTIDIVQAIKNDVSEVFGLITEKDIKGILKKEYGAKSRKMSEATKRKIYVKLLNKAIESLDAQIEKGSRDVVKKVDKYANDSEIQNLRDLKKQRQEELEKIDPSYSDKKKLSNAIDSVNKSISELENKIADSDFSEQQKEVKEVDKKLAELREKRESLRKEYNKRKDEYKKSLVSEDEKRKIEEQKKITVLEKRLKDLKDKKAKDTTGKSSVWNAEISDLQNQIKQEKQRQEEPKKPKIKDVVKQALIDAGFSREITVTKNAKDENGNDIIENGKKVKIKETKEVLDWNKLTGRMNSVEALRANVEGKLKEQGYTNTQIEEISNELETEYKRLTEYIADKALTELERRNQIPKPVNRKSDLDRLVDYHNKGLFSESAKGYERLINKIVGITKREQDVLDKIEAEIEKIKNLREVKIDGSFPDAQSIESQASYIAKSIRNIIAWSNLVNSPLKLQIITVLSDVAGISRAAVLGNLYNAFQNIYSNNRAGFLARMKFKSKGYWTPELNDAFNELKNTVTSDVLLNRGLDFGDTVSPFSNHSIFIEKIKDYINKKYPEGVKRQRAIGILNTFEGRLFLNVMDSRFKSKIVNIDFVMDLVDVLTSERAGKSKMTKEEAVNFVSESLTGVNLEKAKVLAKKFIDDVNAMKEGTLLKNEDNIKRLAFDIVRENLTSGNNFTMDEINDIYQAAMKSGGINIGHESNNIVSEELKSLNNRIEKKVEDAMKEKDFDKATKYATYAFISKNILYPYMSGGLNWAVLEAEAGTPLGLATGAYKSYKNKQLDLLTDVGRKRMKEDLINKRDAESKLFRGIWGTSVAVSAYLAYYGLQAIGAVGDDEDENKRIFNKYLRDNPEQRKIFDKFSPEVYAVSLATSDERLSKYLLNKMGYKTDQNDNVLTLVKSLQDKNSSSAGALGVLLGQVISTPGAWRILRDTKRLYKELQGEPMAQSKRRVTSFLNGYFKGGLVDYLGLRPDVNYDLEKVKKEIDNKKVDFTRYTNGVADDINSGKITVADADKIVKEKYKDNDKLKEKAVDIISKAVSDKEIRDGLKDADTWYMEMYNEKDIRAKAYVYYQNALKGKRETEDKKFYDYMDLALFGKDEEYITEFYNLAIEYKDIEEQSKNKPVN